MDNKKEKLENFKTAISSTVRSISNSKKVEISFGNQISNSDNSSIKLPRYSSLGFILIASGAIGNAIDRILYGKVVDFIDFHIEDLHWPAFNLADTIIFIGATLFLYNQFFTIERTYYEN